MLTKELEHERERYVDLGKRAMQVGHSLWDQTIIGFGSARTVDHAVSNGHLKPVDGRSIPNPIRNLKISVSRMYEWAKRDKKPMDEARQHAIRSITDRAITLFHLDGLPAEVEKYIDTMFA